MKVGTFRLPDRSDFKEVPQGIFRVVDYVARQLSTISQALARRLSFEDNFHSEVVELTVDDQVESLVSLKELRGKPQHFFLTRAVGRKTAGGYYVQAAFRLAEDGRVGVRVKADTAPSEQLNITVLILGR